MMEVFLLRKYLLVLMLLVSSLFILPPSTTSAAEPLPEDIFQWVQSTPRASYYFNKQEITYEIGPDGYADTNILIVPTIRLFDDMQKKDILMKRKWRGLNTYRFNELSGIAEYLRIDKTKKTVDFINCQFLDQGYNPLDTYQRDSEDINKMSPKDVEYKFFTTILDFEQQNRKAMLEKIADKVKPEDLKAAGIKLSSDDKDKNQQVQANTKDKKDSIANRVKTIENEYK